MNSSRYMIRIIIIILDVSDNNIQRQTEREREKCELFSRSKCVQVKLYCQVIYVSGQTHNTLR